MNKNPGVEISILTGLMGFFIGGLINVKNDIVNILLGAVIGGVFVSFLSYFVIVIFFKGRLGIKDSRTGKKEKGKKLDVVLKDEDNYDDIYNMEK